MTIPVYQPKGSMCLACYRWSRDCSGLPFDEMPVMKRDSETVVVKCTAFGKEPPPSNQEPA